MHASIGDLIESICRLDWTIAREQRFDVAHVLQSIASSNDATTPITVALDTLGARIGRHSGYIYALSFVETRKEAARSNDDGLQLAAVSGDGSLRLWAVEHAGSERVLHATTAHNGAIFALAMRRDRIYTGGQDGLIKVLAGTIDRHRDAGLEANLLPATL